MYENTWLFLFKMRLQFTPIRMASIKKKNKATENKQPWQGCGKIGRNAGGAGAGSLPSAPVRQRARDAGNQPLPGPLCLCGHRSGRHLAL